MKKYKFILLAIVGFLITSCGSDDPTITTGEFNATITENPETGTIIGFVDAKASEGSLTYSLSDIIPEGAISINSDGAISVEDASVFDFEINTEVNGQYTASVEGISSMNNIKINITDVGETGFTIWEGPSITFTKTDGSDPTVAINQDQINSDVAITRGNDGGQIYNIITETEADKNASPLGTEWAIGTTSDIASLTFKPFRTAVGSPQDVVGKDLVLHLIGEDAYLDVKFTVWSDKKGGGFAYVRSTK